MAKQSEGSTFKAHVGYEKFAGPSLALAVDGDARALHFLMRPLRTAIWPGTIVPLVPDTPPPCVFCAFEDKTLVWESDLVVAFRDGFPVSEGHTLIVPRRHVATYFEASALEQSEIWRAVDDVRRNLDATLAPDGYNVGFNAGEAAGQTVMHLHVHVIPRFEGDMEDPRGGVRHVIPSKGNYLATKALAPTSASHPPSVFADLPVFVPGQDDHFKNALVQALRLAEGADMLAAFVQPTGLAHLRGDIEDALRRGAKVRMLTGDYLNITSADALRTLLSLAGEFQNFEASFFLVQGAHTSFHPKSYIFTTGRSSIAYVGSSNLSGAALTRSVEWNLRLISEQDTDGLRQIQQGFEDLWSHPQTQTLTQDLIDEYETRAPVPEAPEHRPSGPKPHHVQVLALAALRKTRTEGHRKGLVVLATGLGKTYLSAFDCKAMGGERALFVAHREEILASAAQTWSTIFPDKSVGMLMGGKAESDAELLFASVQTLARKRHLTSFAEDHFDYIVIDEFHHAAASTYRRSSRTSNRDSCSGLPQPQTVPMVPACSNSAATTWCTGATWCTALAASSWCPFTTMPSRTASTSNLYPGVPGASTQQS